MLAVFVPAAFLLMAAGLKARSSRDRPGRQEQERLDAFIVGLFVLGAFLASLRLWYSPRWKASGNLDGDGFSIFLGLLLTAAFTVVVGTLFLSGRGRLLGPRLFLLASLFLLLVSTRDLLWLFLGVQIGRWLCRPTGPARIDRLSTVSALLFFLGLGVLTYTTGAVEMAAIADGLLRAEATARQSGAMAVGVILLALVLEWGLLTWRAWSLPTTAAPLAAFVSLGWLIVFAAALLRVTGWLGGGTPFWQSLAAGLGLVLLVVGSVGIAASLELRGWLRSLSLVQGGFVLIGISGAAAGVAPTLFHVTVSLALILGAILILEPLLGEREALGPINGLLPLGGRWPVAGLGLSLVLLCFASVPATAGFVSKLWIWEAAMAGGQRVSVLMSVVSLFPVAWCVFRLLGRLWSGPPRLLVPAMERRSWHRLTIVVAMILLLAWLSLFPETVMELSRRAASELL